MRTVADRSRLGGVRPCRYRCPATGGSGAAGTDGAGALGIRGRFIAIVVVSSVLGAVAMLSDLAVGNTTLEDVTAGRRRFTPALVLMNTLSLAVLIPVAGLPHGGVHGVGSGRPPPAGPGGAGVRQQ